MFSTPQVCNLVQWFDGYLEEPRAAIVTRVHDPKPAGSIDVVLFMPHDLVEPRLEAHVGILHRTAAAAGEPFWDFPHR